MEEYKIDNSNDEITIEVSVSIPGVVATRINQRRPPSDFDIIAKSTDPPHSNAIGRINETWIGQAKTIIGHEIQVDTIIRLDLVPKTDWPTVYENMSIDYIFRGGINGTDVFSIKKNEKEKTSSGKLIRVVKEIKFTN